VPDKMSLSSRAVGINPAKASLPLRLPRTPWRAGFHPAPGTAWKPSHHRTWRVGFHPDPGTAWKPSLQYSLHPSSLAGLLHNPDSLRRQAVEAIDPLVNPCPPTALILFPRRYICLQAGRPGYRITLAQVQTVPQAWKILACAAFRRRCDRPVRAQSNPCAPRPIV